jgi:predicted Zn-dependent peptidase
MLTTQTAAAQELRTFTLDNGFTVILAEDHSEPKVFGAVAVKAGSKNDPEGHTGTAHYFEHLMFKGTDRIGTVDYEKEKPYLDKIEALYDELAAAGENEASRNRILKQINELSVEAAQYAIPGEVDRLLRKYGGTDINAYTHYDHTVYHNVFSPSHTEKWLAVYAERFRNPVFRMFQAELETVYEERNMYADMMGSKALEDLLQRIIRRHPYRNPIIGTVKDLKTPSISKMREFYKRCYVAGNMALVLAGDFDSQKIMPLVDAAFGKLPSGTAPEFPVESFREAPFNGREFYSARYIPVKAGLVCYRGLPAMHPDKVALDYCMEILSNKSKTGLLDRLRNENKVLMSMCEHLSLNDMGAIVILFVPTIFGKLTKTENEVTSIINRLKSGDFDDELFDALKTSFVKENARISENKSKFGNLLVSLFSKGMSWEEYMVETKKYQTVTKREVVEAANKYFTDNRFVFFNKPGLSGKAEKIKKPEYAPLPAGNAGAQSDFALELSKKKDVPYSPVFVDFDKDFKYGDLKKNVHLVVGKNPLNSIFSITFRFDSGTNGNKLAGLIPEHFNELGTKSRTLAQFRSAMQKLGASCDMSAGKTATVMTVEGFDENFAETMKLTNDFLSNVAPDDAQMPKLLQDLKERNKMERKDFNTLSSAHYNYVILGEHSEYLNRVSMREARKLKSSDIVDLFARIRSFETTITYSGRLSFDEVKRVILAEMKFPEKVNEADRSFFEIRKYESDLVSVLDYKKANQTISYVYVPGEAGDRTDVIAGTFFNSYFGEGMSSIIFREVRELRSLSYLARANYFFPDRRFGAYSGFLRGHLSTQSDKTVEAVQLVDSLVKRMPLQPELMENIREAFKESINNSLPGFRDLPYYGYSLVRQGYEKDLRQIQYENIDTFDMRTVSGFYDKFVRGRPTVHILSGNRAKMGTEKLHPRIQKVRIKDILTE